MSVLQHGVGYTKYARQTPTQGQNGYICILSK